MSFIKTSVLVAILALLLPAGAVAQEPFDVLVFYSETCPHCQAELTFLDELQAQQPGLRIGRLEVAAGDNRQLLAQKLAGVGGERYLGVVPITFVGDELFIGFSGPDGTGQAILGALARQQPDGTPEPTVSPTTSPAAHELHVPLLGTWTFDSASLPVTAVLLGLLDGFNVCSLGALALILGLVLVLQDRRRILLLGGTFLVTTAIIYGLLIVFWYKTFALLASFVGTLGLIIGLLALAGGAYFLVQFYRMWCRGPTCEFTGSRTVQRITMYVQQRLTNPAGLLSAALAVLAFAAVITIVEFPCSAAVPVVFAGMLADAGLTVGLQAAYITLFVLAYLLDELIVFGIAVWGMRLWLSSPRIAIWAALAEGILLLGLGAWYVLGSLGL